MKSLTVIAIALAVSTPADAALPCHKFSIWKYPYPQKCPAAPQHMAQALPLPPENPCRDGLPEMCFAKDIAADQGIPPAKPVASVPIYLDDGADNDIPLPSLEGMEFPPDCIAEWCQHMKGVGMLRDKLGTN